MPKVAIFNFGEGAFARRVLGAPLVPPGFCALAPNVALAIYVGLPARKRCVSGREDDRAQELHLTKIKSSDRTKGQGYYQRTKIYIARENHRVRMRDRAVAAKYGSLKLSAVEFFPM